MRPEVRDKLDAAAKLDRRPFVGAFVFAVILAGIWTLDLWQTYDQRPVLGVVRFAAAIADEQTGQRGVTLQVELENGKIIDAMSFARFGTAPPAGLAPPAIGSTIHLTEQRSFTGYHRYFWAPPQ